MRLPAVRAPGSLTQEEVTNALRSTPIDQPGALVSAMLDDANTPEMDPVYFTPEALKARMQTYEAFTRNTTLKQYLMSLESTMQTRNPANMESFDHVEQRLKELEGTLRSVGSQAQNTALELITNRVRDRLAATASADPLADYNQAQARLHDKLELLEGLKGLYETYTRRRVLAQEQEEKCVSLASKLDTQVKIDSEELAQRRAALETLTDEAEREMVARTIESMVSLETTRLQKISDQQNFRTVLIAQQRTLVSQIEKLEEEMRKLEEEVAQDQAHVDELRDKVPADSLPEAAAQPFGQTWDEEK